MPRGTRRIAHGGLGLVFSMVLIAAIGSAIAAVLINTGVLKVQADENKPCNYAMLSLLALEEPPTWEERDLNTDEFIVPYPQLVTVTNTHGVSDYVTHATFARYAQCGIEYGGKVTTLKTYRSFPTGGPLEMVLLEYEAPRGISGFGNNACPNGTTFEARDDDAAMWPVWYGQHRRKRVEKLREMTAGCPAAILPRTPDFM